MFRITDTTWVEALRRFPHHTTSERLEKFLFIAKKPNAIPKSFQAYCESALTSETLDSAPSNLDVYQLGSSRAL